MIRAGPFGSALFVLRFLPKTHLKRRLLNGLSNLMLDLLNLLYKKQLNLLNLLSKFVYLLPEAITNFGKWNNYTLSICGYYRI